MFESDWIWASQALPYRARYLFYKWRNKFDQIDTGSLFESICFIYDNGFDKDIRVQPFLRTAQMAYIQASQDHNETPP